MTRDTCAIDVDLSFFSREREREEYNRRNKEEEEDLYGTR